MRAFSAKPQLVGIIPSTPKDIPVNNEGADAPTPPAKPAVKPKETVKKNTTTKKRTKKK